MAAAATSDESDSFGGLHMNCQPYSFEPNVRQRCEVTEDVVSVSDETNTADSPENTTSKTDFPHTYLPISSRFHGLHCDLIS